MSDDSPVMPRGITMRDVSTLAPYPGNAREHPPHQIALLATSIQRHGFLVPIVVRGDTITAGHGRVAAARRIGLTQVPCVEADHLDAEEARAFALADNRIAELSTWDQQALDMELADLATWGVDAEALGWAPTDDPWEHDDAQGAEDATASHAIRFGEEAWETVQAAVSAARAQADDPHMRPARAIELVCADYLGG